MVPDGTKFVIEARGKPIIRQKSSGKYFLVIRDDSRTTGQIWIAENGRLNDMFSVNYEDFVEKYETPVGPIKKRAGRPKGSKNKTTRTRRAKVTAET